MRAELKTDIQGIKVWVLSGVGGALLTSLAAIAFTLLTGKG